MGRLRSSRVNEFDVGEMCDRILKGVRSEIRVVIREIERSKGVTVEGMKGLLKDGLEAVISSMEKVMTEASDQVAGEWKRRDWEEKGREERTRVMEERGSKERKRREQEERRMEDRMKKLEEKEKEREEWERNEGLRMARVEECVEKEREERASDARKMLARVKKCEKERERVEREMQDLKEVTENREEVTDKRNALTECKEAERKMEVKVGAAMEEIKILDMDFGKEMDSKEEMVKRAQELIRENVQLAERKEFDWILRRSRTYVLGRATKQKEYEGKNILTVPVLIKCSCGGDKVRLERLIRNAGIRTSFHWPAEIMEYVRGIRERVERMGYGGQGEYVRVKAVRENGGIYLRAEARKKEGRKFSWVGDWLCPPIDRKMWESGVLVDVWMPHRRLADVGTRTGIAELV